MPVEVPPTKVSDLAEKTDPAVGADRLMIIDSVDNLSKKILLSRLRAASSNYLTGPELWRWNKLDMTQFDPVVYHGNSTGTKSGTASAAVVADPQNYARGNIIQLTATSLVGGGVFAVSASEVALPSRYVVSLEYSSVSITGLLLSCMPFCNLEVTNMAQGVATSIGRGGGVGVVTAIVADAFSGNELISGATALATGSTEQRGGHRTLITVRKRPEGGTPAKAFIVNEIRQGGGTLAYDGADVTAIGAVGVAWDGLLLDRVALGCVTEAALSGVGQIADIRIYAHPDD